jgi:hypothetical protein
VGGWAGGDGALCLGGVKVSKMEETGREEKSVVGNKKEMKV